MLPIRCLFYQGSWFDHGVDGDHGDNGGAAPESVTLGGPQVEAEIDMSQFGVIMTVQGLGFCLFESFAVAVLLPLLYDQAKFKSMTWKLFDVVHPDYNKRTCKLLYEYWKANFDPEVLIQWPEWPHFLSKLRWKCCSLINTTTIDGCTQLQKHPWLKVVWADLLKSDEQGGGERISLKDLTRKYTWAPPEVAWALSMVLGPERHVVMSQHDECYIPRVRLASNRGRRRNLNRFFLVSTGIRTRAAQGPC